MFKNFLVKWATNGIVIKGYSTIETGREKVIADYFHEQLKEQREKYEREIERLKINPDCQGSHYSPNDLAIIADSLKKDSEAYKYLVT